MHLRLNRVWDKKLNMISEYRDNFGRRVFLFRLGKDALPPFCSILDQIISSESIPFFQNESVSWYQFFSSVYQFLSSESISFYRINSFLQNHFLSSESIPFLKSIPFFIINSFLQNKFLSSESVPLFRARILKLLRSPRIVSKESIPQPM
jgi:hypothetical protein